MAGCRMGVRGVTVLVALLLGACQASPGRQVVVYASLDQHHAEPVLRAFAEQTGIEVLPVYDVEATKTTGLVNRLIAERDHPQADVYWSGEFAQTILLKEQGVLAPYASPSAEDIPEQFRDSAHYWCGTAGRARVLVVNTELLAPEEYPRSLTDLLSERWPAGQVAVALPLFGTSATHAAALYASLGAKEARSFYAQLKERGVQIVDGNSMVRDRVASGQALWGLTDTDDVAGALARGLPVAAVFPDQGPGESGTLLIPTTVALIAGAAHPAEGQQLVDFLLSRETEALLVQSGWCHAPLRKLDVKPEHFSGEHPRMLDVSLDEVYRQIETVKRELREVFIK